MRWYPFTSWWPAARRLAIVSVSILLLPGMLVGCHEPAPIVIGALLPMTGSAKLLGVTLENAFDLAVYEVNAQGGVDGRPLKVLIEDSGSSSGAAVERAFQALMKHQPLLTVAVTSPTAMAVKPLAEAQESLLFGLVVTAPQLTRQTDWVYRYWPTAEHENTVIQAMIPVNTQALGVLFLENSFGRSVYNSLVAHKDHGAPGRIRGIDFAVDQSDFNEPVAALKDCDALVIVGLSFHIKAILKTLQAAGYAGLRIGTLTATLPDIVSMPEADGLHVVAPAIYNPNFIFPRAVAERYESRFGRPFDQSAAVGYDFILMLTGLMRNRSDGREALRQETVQEAFRAGFIYPGIFGTLSLQAGANDIHFPLFPGTIENGRIIFR